MSMNRCYLNIFNVVEQQLDENRNNILLSNQHLVVWLSGENVQSSDRALDDLLHAHSIGIGARLLRTTAGHRRALLNDIKSI